jgi:hypothetical protein
MRNRDYERHCTNIVLVMSAIIEHQEVPLLGIHRPITVAIQRYSSIDWLIMAVQQIKTENIDSNSTGILQMRSLRV